MRSAYDHMIPAAAEPLEAFNEDQMAKDAMTRGNAMMLKALETGRGPDRLVWHTPVPPAQPKLTPYRELMSRRALRSLAQKEDAIARKVSREPCPVCATRADIGCKHQRVA